MMLRRSMSVASVACGLTLTFGGSALAANVTIDKTGAGSQQTVVIDNKSDVTSTNTSTVDVTNVNIQQATTGDVVAKDNTSVGGLVQSGPASNDNAGTTTVTVTNSPVVITPVGGVGAVGGSGQPGTPSVTPAGGSQGGQVLGASTTPAGRGGAIAMLPVTGPSVPMDVSALRNAWHPQTITPSATLAKGSQMLTGAMLITATLLSLLGALGSARYAKRREERV